MGIKNKRTFKGKWIKFKNGYYGRIGKDNKMIVFIKGKQVVFKEEPYEPREK